MRVIYIYTLYICVPVCDYCKRIILKTEGARAVDTDDVPYITYITIHIIKYNNNNIVVYVVHTYIYI